MHLDSKVSEILFRWERRRILYNLILLPLGVILLAVGYQDFRMEMSPVEMAGACIGIALAANWLYCLAPLAEVYSFVFLKWEWKPWMRNLVFAFGLATSVQVMVLGVFAGMASIELSNQ